MTKQFKLVVLSAGVIFASASALGETRRGSSDRQSPQSESARLIAGNGEELRGGIAEGTVTAAGGAHMSLRPIRAIGGAYSVNGNTITVKQTPADVVIEGWFGGWGPSALTGYCMRLDTASFASGPGAPLGPGQIPCSTDADCRAALGAPGVAGDLHCNDFATGRCNHLFQDETNPARPPFFNILGCNQAQYNCGGATSNPPAPDTGMDAYNMTAVLHIPGGARGTYDIRINELDHAFTYINVGITESLDISSFEPAFINVLPEDACIGGMSNGLPCSQHSDCPGGRCHLKNRFISFVPSEIAPTGGIQVTLVSLHPNSVMNPAAYNGTVRWVGPPALGVSDHPIGTYNAGPLQCGFHSQDWSGVGRLHVYGAAIVPGSVYDVRICATEAGPCSAPLRIGTADWGDVVAPLGPANFTDIWAVVATHKFLPGCPSRTRSKLHQPVNPSAFVNAIEIGDCVAAFQGIPYKVKYSTPPPTCP